MTAVGDGDLYPVGLSGSVVVRLILVPMAGMMGMACSAFRISCEMAQKPKGRTDVGWIATRRKERR